MTVVILQPPPQIECTLSATLCVQRLTLAVRPFCSHVRPRSPGGPGTALEPRDGVGYGCPGSVPSSLITSFPPLHSPGDWAHAHTYQESWTHCRSVTG